MEGGGLFHRTMTRISFFVAGATVCYAFANPDEGNVYDIFPTQKSRFAFITEYRIPAQNKWNFESKWKDLARYYQQQEGYLFNKLVRSKQRSVEMGEFRYFSIMQWSTGESFLKSMGKATHKTLADELPQATHQPLMYKLVVDDTEFDPTESFAPYNGRS
jgi:heme-degrading monooxygenase HmoA